TSMRIRPGSPGLGAAHRRLAPDDRLPRGCWPARGRECIAGSDVAGQDRAASLAWMTLREATKTKRTPAFFLTRRHGGRHEIEVLDRAIGACQLAFNCSGLSFPSQCLPG